MFQTRSKSRYYEYYTESNLSEFQQVTFISSAHFVSTYTLWETFFLSIVVCNAFSFASRTTLKPEILYLSTDTVLYIAISKDLSPQRIMRRKKIKIYWMID